MWLYRFGMTLALPLLWGWALLRLIRDTEPADVVLARLGFGRGRGPDGQTTLWLHAASNGELASAESLVRLWLTHDPDLHILVTTNSTSGQDKAKSWGLDRVSNEVAPFDTRRAARRLIRRWNVTGLVVMESEFWPNRLQAIAALGLPVIFLGARISRKTAKGWRRFKPLASAVLNNISLVVPQDKGTARRLKRFGLDPVRLEPVTDLKALYSAESRPAPDAALRHAFDRDMTWLAASTHEGEDERILAAHNAARATLPDLRLILAPRHAHRAAHLRAGITSTGLSVAQRSQDEPPETADVYLVDTMNEMSRFYDLSAVTFVAGSLVDKGGHTPFEPIAHGSAVLHGPYVRNFQAIYRKLDIHSAAQQVADATELSAALVDIFANNRAEAMTDTARRLAETENIEKLALRVLRLMGRNSPVF